VALIRWQILRTQNFEWNYFTGEWIFPSTQKK
jgi:hypothetical protein